MSGYSGKIKNKAGYTANTSCGRVGRGGNARFHTFRLVFTDRPTNGRTDGRTDGQTKPLIELRVRNLKDEWRSGLWINPQQHYYNDNRHRHLQRNFPYRSIEPQRIQAKWNDAEMEVITTHMELFYPLPADGSGRQDLPDESEIELIILPKLEGLNPDNPKSIAKVDVSYWDCEKKQLWVRKPCKSCVPRYRIVTNVNPWRPPLYVMYRLEYQ